MSAVPNAYKTSPAAGASVADPSLPPGGGWRQSSSRIPQDPERQPSVENAKENLNAAMQDLKKAAEFASHFASAKIDQVKLTVRMIVLYAILGVVGLVVGLGVLFTAGALIVIGLAGAISGLMGGRHMWLGDLLAGIIILAIVAIGAMVVSKKIVKTSRSQTVNKYEHRRQQQQADFGTDVHEQAQRGL